MSILIKYLIKSRNVNGLSGENLGPIHRYGPPSQIISRFGFSRFIVFLLHIYIYIMSGCVVKFMNLKKIKMTNNLGWRE